MHPASCIVSEVIRPVILHRALRLACTNDVLAMSQPVRDELVEMLHRPRLARSIDPSQRDAVLALRRAHAASKSLPAPCEPSAPSAIQWAPAPPPGSPAASSSGN